MQAVPSMIFDASIVVLQEQCGSDTFIPYVVSPQGKVFACDVAMMTCIKDLMQPSFQLEPLLIPLVEKLVHLLNNVHIQSRSDINFSSVWLNIITYLNIIIQWMHVLELPTYAMSLSVFTKDCEIVECNTNTGLSADSEYFRESIRHEIRMARERFSGRALSEELNHIQQRLDSVDLLSPDIVMNLLLSYRDVQVCISKSVCLN